ncbi:hypothetical protein ABPG75_002945 [Micractinium tetrahymenae]
MQLSGSLRAPDGQTSAGDNHVRPKVIAAAAATPQPEGIFWNASDDAAAAHAETTRHSMESADFWVSDVDQAEVPPPVHQEQERAAYMHIWSSASLVVDAETSRNSLDSCDFFME